MKFILGTKGASEQIFNEAGIRIPVTHINTAACYVVGIKTLEQDGYWAVKLAFGTAKNINKPQSDELKKAGIKTPLRFLREIRFRKSFPEMVEKDKKKGIKMGEKEIFIGDVLKPGDVFKVSDIVNVTGTSKGKGFQGVVRRHRFAGGPRTHGQSDRERAPGSIGASTTPGRVYKGKRMAGRMGGDTVTVKHLTVMAVADDSIAVKGLVPGSKRSLLIIQNI